MQKWEEAEQDYVSGMKYKDIAAKHGVTVSAVKSWKARKWSKEKVATKKNITVATKVNMSQPVATESTKFLSPKQRRFADEYLVSGNAYQAAIGAGYADGTARNATKQLLDNTGIKIYIENKLKVESNAKIADAKEIMELFTAILRGETTETVVVTGPSGLETTKKEPDIKTRILASKELIKRFPNEDALLKAQIKRATAEADIAEFKAKELMHLDDGGETTTIVDDMEAIPDE